MKRQTAFVAIALLSLFLTVTFPASALGQGHSAPTASTTTRVSVASDGTQGNDFSGDSSISATGRFVTFDSPATNLVSGDTNGVSDVFVHDRKTGQTTRVSVASDGTQGNEFSDAPSISATGRYVAFQSAASNLVSGDTNGTGDIFVHDRATGQITLVSVASDGTQGNGAAQHAMISANGRYVAFQSDASTLVSGDTNNTHDVFVHDRETGQTTRVSVRSNGTQGNGLSVHPSLSATGRYVAFDSEASNLVHGDKNSTNDVFVHDRETGQTTLVSISSDGTQANGFSYVPSISASGRFVAFVSYATNLVSGDTNFAPDIFVYDRQNQQTTRVSVASDGAQGNSDSSGPSISANGRYVAFDSFASNLVSGDTNNTSDVFVHGLKTGQTTRVSVASNGTQGNDGSFDPYPSSISATGRFVAFTSFATNLVSGDTNGVTDIFVHDQQGGGSVEDPLPAEPEGFHESHFEGSQNQFSCFAVGWAADPDDRDIDLNVRVLSDNVEVAQTVAGTFREGLEEAGACPGGTCFFSVDLWGLISPDVDHLITVQAQDAQTGEWVDLSDTPRTLNCSEENVLPEGFHDAEEGTQYEFSCVAWGWATDPNDRNIDLAVRILSDGVEVARTTADAFRPDLEDAGVCPGGTCSFSIDLWDLISRDTDHSIMVQAQDAQTAEWADLSETPRTLNCTELEWEQLNINGFGDSQTNGVISLELFKSKVYAGTANGAGGAVWRWQQDGQFQQVSETGFGYGSANSAIIDLAVFQGNLYAGMGWGDAPGQVWRSADGTNWQPVTTDGFGDANNTAITNFVVFKGLLYAGTGPNGTSAQIWRSKSGNSNSWTQVAPDGPGLSGNVTGFAVYKGVLYAALEPSSGVDPMQVWRSANGSNWTTVAADGFGDLNNVSTGGFAQFGGYLYLGTRNEATGGQVWRTADGLHWDQVVSDGFGDINNIKVESLLVYSDVLYATTFNWQGLQIWRSVDGMNWEQTISSGFGDRDNFSTLWNNAAAKYHGQILIGTWNGTDGGELWMSAP